MTIKALRHRFCGERLWKRPERKTTVRCSVKPALLLLLGFSSQATSLRGLEQVLLNPE
jgi:hypothetical protein